MADLGWDIRDKRLGLEIGDLRWEMRAESLKIKRRHVRYGIKG
jgi:hypothetical protein